MLSWLFTRQERAPTAVETLPEGIESRMAALEQQMSGLLFEWESVISKIKSKVARDAARTRRETERLLEEGDGEGERPSFDHEAAGNMPAPGTQEHRALMKAQLRRQAATLRQGRTG